MSEGIPDFALIGAMKSGTTTLYRQLRSHPGVYMPQLKEPNFFIAERNWSRGFDWYRSLFADAPPGAILGEASTNYSKGTTFPGVPERLRAHAPDLKIIYLLRDPVERIRSHYAHSVYHGRERRSPEDAIRPRSGYVRTTLYGAELQRYLDHFPSDQILVLLTEDLRDDPEGLLSKVQQFLGLEDFSFRHVDRHYHVTKNRRIGTRLGSVMERNPRLADVGQRVLPEKVWDRLVTRSVGTDGIAVPASALDQIRDVLAADRELLTKLVDLEFGKWTPIDQHDDDPQLERSK